MNVIMALSARACQKASRKTTHVLLLNVTHAVIMTQNIQFSRMTSAVACQKAPRNVQCPTLLRVETRKIPTKKKKKHGID